MSKKSLLMEKQDYFNDLKEIITDKISIGLDVSDLKEEISNNKWIISMSQELCSITDKDDFLNFFNEVIENRKKQISNSNRIHGMIFYLWFDVQSCHLCFNLISDFHKKLPFGCKLNILDNLDIIVEEFLNDDYHNGIPKHELKEVNLEENNKNDEIDNYEYILNVYRLDIKKN